METAFFNFNINKGKIEWNDKELVLDLIYEYSSRSVFEWVSRIVNLDIEGIIREYDLAVSKKVSADKSSAFTDMLLLDVDNLKYWSEHGDSYDVSDPIDTYKYRAKELAKLNYHRDNSECLKLLNEPIEGTSHRF